ncbi:MAG: prepilin-type N-terminal cleavage/methylation domain-containing protein [Gammaproteobacteria bacterium]|nr:prepilin-type N-terminal cleavage/methylation domain-containing protein [Gammaproteobacteria bacterium]
MVTIKKILKHAGFTLLEIITTVVVIAVAATALMSVFSSTIRTSADPVLQHQALAIAEAYMEEILLKDFTVGPGNTRPTFDDVRDYNGLNDVGARDQGNNPIAGLTDYTISVTVVNDGLNGIAAVDSLRINIVVSRALIDDILLSGYRVNY